jgi:WD40 repeat protein
VTLAGGATAAAAAEDAPLIGPPNHPQHQQPTTNENLEVRACVFSPDQTYLAWSCGYGIVKIMKLLGPSSTKDDVANKQHNHHRHHRREQQQQRQQSLEHNELIEFDASESVWSLAFGSSKSTLKYRGQAARAKNVYRRYDFMNADNALILAVGLASGRIRIYDAVKSVFLFGLFDHSAIVRDLKFTQDGSLQ